MTKGDMALLIEAEDALADMDQVLEQLTGSGHSNGVFIELDSFFNLSSIPINTGFSASFLFRRG